MANQLHGQEVDVARLMLSAAQYLLRASTWYNSSQNKISESSCHKQNSCDAACASEAAAEATQRTACLRLGLLQQTLNNRCLAATTAMEKQAEMEVQRENQRMSMRNLGLEFL